MQNEQWSQFRTEFRRSCTEWKRREKFCKVPKKLLMNTLIELTNYLSRTEVLINGRKKDIYKCNKLKGDDALVIWYNEVIEKSPDELNISDVARCIRQNLFT